MTKREQYGLSFINLVTSDNTIKKNCRKDIVDQFSELQLITRFDIEQSKSLIDHIGKAVSNENFDPIYSSDFIDDNSIEIDPPFVIINDILHIKIEDLKELFNEWIMFLKE